MSEPDEVTAAPVKSWLAMPMEASAQEAIERVRRAEDVVHIAVMPDVHLAGDVCVGTAMATRRLIYPSAVGGDIGCGMLAMAFNAAADLLREPANAGELLRLLARENSRAAPQPVSNVSFPASLKPGDLSHPALRSLADEVGRLQLGTLGGGNHFVEMQADEDEQLWVMIHSGSRAMGQEVKAHHLSRATIRSASMLTLDADKGEGQAYLHDQAWARQFAQANRQRDGRANRGGSSDQPSTFFPWSRRPLPAITITFSREEHFGQSLLVHRKGAMPAEAGSAGVVPGSMGTLSLHVEGRGARSPLRSQAHGAGRLLSRRAARERFNLSSLRQQMQGVWFDPRLSEELREESPKSYKDVRAVMRAQRELVKITRTLQAVAGVQGGG